MSSTRNIIAFAAALLALACIPKPPEFAPEQVTTRFSTEASVREVARSAATVLRTMEWRVEVEYVADSAAAVSGEYVKSLPERYLSKSYWQNIQVPADWGWISATTLQVTATRTGDLTQTTIVPDKRGLEGPLPLGTHEVRLTKRLTESLQRALRSRSS